ncbi:MAG: hypothetical protein Q9214_002234, partial [Letrouitia sp. 1 TL-2023]
MNISQPIASHIGSVDFGFLSSEEVKALSVKRIQNATTFDSLLHPVPGGLYDPALGAWRDNPCGTCFLTTYTCPGHAGHIELPVPVYHVTFMDQFLILLNSKCEICSRFKLHPAETHRFICKLRLIQHGLVCEAHDLDNLDSKSISSRHRMANGAASRSSSESEDLEEDEDSLRQKRESFVRRAIRKAKHLKNYSIELDSKVEAVAAERRTTIKEFLAAMRKARAGIKAVNPLIKAREERKTLQRQRREDRDVDEGIVADLEDITSEEDEDLEMLEADAGFLAGSALERQSKPSPSKSNAHSAATQDEFVTPQELHAALTELFRKEHEVLNLVYDSRRQKSRSSLSADMFFIRDLLVPPNKYRPEHKTGEKEIAEGQQNTVYKYILQHCDQLYQIRKDMDNTVSESTVRPRDFRDFQNVWVALQESVNGLVDCDRNPRKLYNRTPLNGIKQILEKKEGLFRMNMMGKRVNFAARTVISPDPNIETNEIGVPPVFARKLTYPEPVTNHNFYELKQAVLNGVDKWPGAAAVENENGQVINLRTKNFEERQALANQLLAPSNVHVNGSNNKKVHRHLTNGDVVIMNRQPTLHKPSMMAHRAKVLPGEKTIRLHYVNCNAYNADFDGDEMNMHFPQNEIARSEALHIADTDHQYLVATAGQPLRGLIQDHISISVWLTNRDTMFRREDYYQLLCSCLRPEDNLTTFGRIITVQPAILKPQQMWTGKQVVTTILKNITPASHPGLTLQGKSKTTGDRWGSQFEEDMVHFQDGELLCGILDKAHLGPTGGGFVHSIYEAYGHNVAGQLLSVFARLLTKFLAMRAFTCGMDDLDLTKVGEHRRKEKLTEADTTGFEVARKYVTLDQNPTSSEQELNERLRDVLRDEAKQAGLDSVYNARTATLSSEITKICLPDGLRKPFPKNQMQTMTSSGAKGSVVNANQISCNLGQQVLEGRRVPIMISGKSLPSFKPFETSVRAGGYVTDRFLTGIRPQAYFFHAMAGREGLIDTAVKTSRSGYLQRCLIKGMEAMITAYDGSVRDSDGSVVQFLYGEDGLDVIKQSHLTNFKFLAENYLSLVAQLNLREEFSKLKEIGASKYNKKAMKRVRKTRNIAAMDPALALYNPGAVYGSTSESFAAALEEYSNRNPQNLIKDKKTDPEGVLTKKTFRTLLDAKYMKSVVDPGEMVGVVAGQSIGEPSTQMTLNTFHLAGHAAKNVTLGIPRLREIVMTASRAISTPTMTLQLIEELDQVAGERFAKGITRLTLAEVIDDATVVEQIGSTNTYETAKIYDIRFDLFPSHEYSETYAIKVEDVLRTIEFSFIPQLTRAILKELTRKGDAKLLEEGAAQPEIGKATGAVEEAQPRQERENEASDGDEEDDDDNDGDDDAMGNKQRQNRTQAISYAGPDAQEETIARDTLRQSTPQSETDDEGYGGSPGSLKQNKDSDEDSDEDEPVRQPSTKVAKDRVERIRHNFPHITRFSFDYKGGSWCALRLEYDVSTAKILLPPILESVCHSSVIQSIPGITSATCTRERIVGTESHETLVLTQGVNLQAMHAYQSIINPHRIFTNDIGAMLAFYGVEAARATIIREMDAVFKGHSISVDNRHLNLIADVMTRGGGFTPFSRLGLRGATSPLMKMSYETTLGFLRDAVLDQDWDTLEGPSARLVVGK